MASEPNGRNPDPGSRVILAELRDLRREMRADRQEAKEDRPRSEAERRRSDERFEHLLRDFRQDSARRETATQQALVATQNAFRDIRGVGLSIVKTLNRHTKILERIERLLGARNNGRPGDGNGRGRAR